MGIINRRNAMLGWSVWQVAKAMAKRKARQTVPGTGEHAGLNKSAVVAIVAAIAGALFFWRRKAGGGEATAA